MRQAFVILILSGVLACQADRAPEGLMERDDFKAALLDAQLIEARMNHELVLEQMEAMPAEKYYQELFDEHDITRADFDSTFRYYTERPVELRSIYNEILEELTLMKDSAI